MDDLTPQQDLFCKLYTQNDELFSNATLAYAEAYQFELDTLSKEMPVEEESEDGKPIKYGDSEYDLAYNTCSVNASRLLRSAKIQDKVTKYLNEMLTDVVVDSQMAKLILQDRKYESKIAAIREYNKLRQRITDRVDLTTKGDKIEVADPKAISLAKEYEDKLKAGI